MKSIYSALALAGGLLFAAPTVQAQTPPDAQCITATATTPYTQPGSTYGNNPNNFDWKTPIWNLMAVLPTGSSRIPFFSNPNVSFDGFPTGIDGNGTVAAYNAKKIRNFFCTADDFKSPKRTPEHVHSSTLRPL